MIQRRSLAVAAALFCTALQASGLAHAQRAPQGGYQTGSSQGPKRITQPGQFDYYLLAMSWSPSYCASLPRDGYDPQCHRRDGRRYAFVLHGLWPQFERGWPSDCPTADRGFVPGPVADRMLDIMPSKKLVFHEYRKHGTCSGLGVDGYFDLSRKLFQKVTVPERYRNLSDPRTTVSPGQLISEFLSVNPGLKPDMLAVECGGPGNRLKEVRICFDKAGEFRSCGRNEDQRRLCNAASMYVPPVRVAPPQSTVPQSPSLKERLQRYVPGQGQRI